MILRRLVLALKALRQMGLQPLVLYGVYRLGIWTGHYRRLAPVASSVVTSPAPELSIKSLFPLPSRRALDEVLGEDRAKLLAEADGIASGKVRLFGAAPAPLVLTFPAPLKHWTAYERGQLHPTDLAPSNTEAQADLLQEAGGGATLEGARDIKFVWEPGRFGWAYTLGRAFYLSGDPRYAQAFWEASETFLSLNPPNQGPHWSSAQEVALRLIALIYASQVFADAPCSTPERQSYLAQAVASHAARIPPTLVYARSQNNNHLLSEAAGLYSAGVFLSGHPAALRWRELGWRWLQQGFCSQIANDGAYTQNSANYHRLMLQLALWVHRIAQVEGRPFPELSMQRLCAATRWLLVLVDPQTGQAPNLGPNDGAYILPLTNSPFSDYRPVVQAACQTFLGKCPFPAGVWDEMCLWLAVGEKHSTPGCSVSTSALHQTPHILRSPSGRSWAYFRIARHATRPGHADQLHLDLWCHGLNIAQDAGTYLYNGSAPWENALASTFVHNTVTVAGQEQMQRAGRFLWLDWAQGQMVSGEPGGEGAWQRLLARHDGYRRLGIQHQRQVTVVKDELWTVEDELVGLNPTTPGESYEFRLHWLLPDWPWEVVEREEAGFEFCLRSPFGPVVLCIQARSGPKLAQKNPLQNSPLRLQLVRAGELVHGSGPVSPTWGWASPTYGYKTPGLSLSAIVETCLPVSFTSQWTFPD